jgi:hypothetical protein
MESLAKTLVFAGLALAALGVLIWAFASLPYVGKLPGDIYIRRGNFTFYFPLATGLILSVILSILFTVLRR